MPSRRQHYARAARTAERAFASPAAEPDAIIGRLLAAAGDVLQITSSCWHHTDAVSGLPVSGGAMGDPPGSVMEALEYEYRRPDVNRFGELRSRRERAASLSLVTGDRPSESARFREMIAPTGAADELRVSFSDSFGTWAAVVMFTGRRMMTDDVQFVEALVPTVTAALRRANAAAAVAPVESAGEDQLASAVLMLDENDRIMAADATARRRLSLVPESDPGHVPGLISFLAAQARWGTARLPATARMRTIEGRWFVVEASLLEGSAPGTVAVVMRPAPPSVVLDSVLRPLGLSTRERQVAALVLQGRGNKDIAATLSISPWTVQDHLKAIYEKTGLGSRTELVALAGPVV
jgi:DNA-binding CsgD family transcriptional regulator